MLSNTIYDIQPIVSLLLESSEAKRIELPGKGLRTKELYYVSRHADKTGKEKMEKGGSGWIIELHRLDRRSEDRKNGGGIDSSSCLLARGSFLE